MNRFPNGARVCFIGDSITHNNLFLAHIVAYYREHFKDSKVKFYNCGVSCGKCVNEGSYCEKKRIVPGTHNENISVR